MAKLLILTYPDPRLRKKAAVVEVFDEEIVRIKDDMLETMYAANGVGLSATQVDIQKAIVVADTSEHGDNPICLVNPKIIETSGQEEMEEGCLSVPGIYANVQRAEHIVVEAKDETGASVQIETGGLLAVCIQHEMDHLQGKLFVDYLSAEKRRLVLEKVKEIKRTGKIPKRETIPYALDR
ncbi:MAG: peptide deformylase [Gammaproteobacteria bacterium]|nr:peptide deformylase [Gammaproteobacteria bacterium]